MDFNLKPRLAIARRIWGHRRVKIAIAIWGVICTYDTALSQIIPESLGHKLPKIRDAIAMSSGFLPFWVWLLVLAAIFIVASLEYAVRRSAMALHAETPDQTSEVSEIKMASAAKKVAGVPSPAIKATALEAKAIITETYRENWERSDLRLGVLYRFDGNRLFLKYSPDTKNAKADALLLILFGHKKILNMNEVPYSTANTALMSIPASNNELESFIIATLASQRNAVTVARDDLGNELVERVALSMGGKLRLTATGYRRAYDLAEDLIRRG
jgi:hypothetical protein